MRMRTLLAAAAIAALASAAPGRPYDPLVLSRGWERAAQFAGEDCAGEVGTNGRFYVISASGFAPGEPAFLTITNGDMRPIEREVRTDARGEWREYYIPFRYLRDGGSVEVRLAGESCVVALGFEWRRAKGWNDPAPLQPR